MIDIAYAQDIVSLLAIVFLLIALYLSWVYIGRLEKALDGFRELDDERVKLINRMSAVIESQHKSLTK